jgi:hypothetical protein
MPAIKSESNRKTSSADPELPTVDELTLEHVAHIDEGIHSIERKLDQVLEFIEEHKPALDRAKALMDPGAKLRDAFRRKDKS